MWIKPPNPNKIVELYAKHTGIHLKASMFDIEEEIPYQAWREFIRRPPFPTVDLNDTALQLLKQGQRRIITSIIAEAEIQAWSDAVFKEGLVFAHEQTDQGIQAFIAADESDIEKVRLLTEQHRQQSIEPRHFHRQMGEYCGVPDCCIKAYVEIDGPPTDPRRRHAAAKKSTNFVALLNNLDPSSRLIPWEPCSYDCQASIDILEQAQDDSAETALNRLAIKWLLGIPRLYSDSNRQILLDGVPTDDGVNYYQFFAPRLKPSDRQGKHLSWGYFAQLWSNLSAANRFQLDDGAVHFYQDERLHDTQNLPQDTVLFPFTLSEQELQAVAKRREHYSEDMAEDPSLIGKIDGGIKALPTEGPTKEHLKEAVSVTTRGSDIQVEIQLGHLCNNRCVFCVSGQLSQMRLAPPMPAKPVLDAIEQAAQRGCTKITFLGGEPTLQRSFLPALDYALERGFTEVVIFTNGVRGKQQSFLQQIIDRGNFTWRFSLQGGNAQAHDEVTKRPGSFAKIIAGMQWLKARNQDLTSNMCVNEYSYRSLGDFPELLAKYGVRQLHIDVIRPAGVGRRTDEYLQSIMPRYSDMAPYFDDMLSKFDKKLPDFDVNIGNMPYCILPKWTHRIHHGGEMTLTVAADDGYVGRVWNKYQFQRSGMVYSERCDTCIFRTQCRGVPAKYADFYGTDEFRPITYKALEHFDPEQKSFSVGVWRWLEPWLQTDLPSNWSLVRIFRDVRARRVEVTLSYQQDTTLQLIFSPRQTLCDWGHLLLESPHFNVSFALQPPQPPLPALTKLFHNIKAALLQTMDAATRQMIPLLQMAKKIRDQQQFASWQWSSTSLVEQTVVVRLVGPNHHGGEIILGINHKGARQIKVQLDAKTDPAQAKKPLQMALALLQRKTRKAM